MAYEIQESIKKAFRTHEKKAKSEALKRKKEKHFPNEVGREKTKEKLAKIGIDYRG